MSEPETMAERMSDASRLDELFAQRWSGRLNTADCAKVDAEIALIQIKAQVAIAEALTKLAEPPVMLAQQPMQYYLGEPGQWGAVYDGK